jgi:hypothetical protein
MQLHLETDELDVIAHVLLEREGQQPSGHKAKHSSWQIFLPIRTGF